MLDPQKQETLEVESSAALTMVENHEITNSGAYEDAGAILQVIKAGVDLVHQELDPICKATNAAHKEATGLRRRYLDPYQRAEKLIKRKMGAYKTKELERLREGETVPQAKAEGTSTRRRWTFEVTDQDALPREFLTPDLKKIGEVVQALGPNAARVLGEGVKIEETVTIAVRTK